MNFAELIVNLEAELSKISAILRNLQEQINEIKAFAKEQGLLEECSKPTMPVKKTMKR